MNKSELQIEYLFLHLKKLKESICPASNPYKQRNKTAKSVNLKRNPPKPTETH